MKNWILSLNATGEFVTVIALALAWPVIGSTFALFHPNYVVGFSDASLWTTVLCDILVLSLVAVILSARGWKSSAFNFEISGSSFVVGIALAAASYLAYATVYTLMASLMAPMVSATGAILEASDLSLVTILIWSIVNAMYEEAIVVGYVFAALGKTRSINFAINVSVGLRLLYHLYQGAPGVIAIVPMGLLFAFFFARWKRLGPLIIAHFLMDFLWLLWIR